MATRRINLLPADQRPRLEIQPEMVSVGIGAFFIASVLVTSVSNHFAMVMGQRELASVKAENSEISAKVATYQAGNDRANQRKQRLTTFEEVTSRKVYWVEMFKELSTIMPKDVWLTSMESSITEHDKKITLKGEAISQEKVAEFLKALEKSTYFNTISMKTSERQDDYRPDLYDFEFSVPIIQASKPEVVKPGGNRGGKA